MFTRCLALFRRFVQKITHRPSEMDVLTKRGLRVGKNFRNHSPHLFDALFPWLITVGDNVCVSANVKILAHDTSTEYVNGHTKVGIVEIGNNVYIGYGSTIMCNVRIGDNAIIGAGSIVTKDIPAGTVYAGNPARFICTQRSMQQNTRVSWHAFRFIAVRVKNGGMHHWKKRQRCAAN